MLFSFFMNLYHEWRAFLNIFYWGNYKDDRHNTMLQLRDFKALLTLQIWFSTSGFFQCPWTGFVFLFSSVARSCLTLCNPTELQHTRPPCPSPTPRVYPNSCSLSQWFHLTISSSVIPFSCLQSFPRLGADSSNESALHIRWPKYWSFSFNIRPSDEHSELISFRMDWLDFLAVQGTPIPQFKSIHSSALSFLHSPPIYSVYRRKNLMSIKLVHIKLVYELLSSRPRDQIYITSISCTGRQITDSAT